MSKQNSANSKTSFNNVANVVASRIKDLDMRAKWATVNKQMQGLLIQTGIPTKDILQSLHECFKENNVEMLILTFPIKYTANPETKYEMVKRIQFMYSKYNSRFELRFGLGEDDIYYKLGDIYGRSKEEYNTQVSTLDKMLENFRENVIDKIPKGDYNVSKNSDYYTYELELEIEFDDDNCMSVIDYCCKKLIDSEKEPEILCETRNAKCDAQTVGKFKAIVKSWIIYEKPKQTGSSSKIFVMYDGKKRKVYHSKTEKFIVVNKQKVNLSSIRNKYRYVKS
jgi:hypothetical protein